MAAATTLTPYQKFQQSSAFYNSATRAASYLPPKDQVSAALTNRSWRIVVDCHYGALLQICIERQRPVYLTDSTHQQQQVQLKTILGRGYCKIAFDIGEGRALLLPYQGVLITTAITLWRRVVREELGMTECLTSWGLLTPLSRPVLISIFKSRWKLPAYVSESFANLAAIKGCYIRDIKNNSDNTWIRGEHYLFRRAEDRLVEKNWDAVFAPLLSDVVIYAKCNLPIGESSMNLAIVKNPNPSPDAPSPYVVRLFGFDFSNKYAEMAIPQKNELSRPRLSDEGIGRLFEKRIYHVLQTEFWNMDQSFGELAQTLVEKYTKAVLSRL